MNRREPEVCPNPEINPNLLAELFTEADILAKRHEFEQGQEQEQKAELAKMEKTICELEQRKKKDEVTFRMAYHQVVKRAKRAEARIVAAKVQHQQCIEDVLQQYAVEREGYALNLQNLQRELDEDKQTYQDKKEELKRAEMANMQTLEKRKKNLGAITEEIEQLQKKLHELNWAHEEKKKGYKDNSEERVRAFTSDSNKLKARIDEVRSQGEKANMQFRRQEMDLIRQRDEMLGQEQLDREEMEVRMGGLLMEKDDYTQRIAFLEKKVEQRKQVEKRKAIEVNKLFEDIMRDNTGNFKREKDDNTRRILMKEDELRQMEGELVSVREHHDSSIKDINYAIDKQKRDAQQEMKIKEDNYKERIDNITDQNRHKELEDSIHNKRCVIMNLEADQQAEETFLQTRLKFLAEKEKYLRDGLHSKEMKFSDYLISIENELSQTKTKAIQEQHAYDNMKAELDKNVAEAQRNLRDDIKEVTARLNNINKDICDVQRSIKETDEGGKEREDELERRIGEEVKRLQTMKSDLEEQIPPMQEKHNNLKQTIKEDKENHEKVFEALKEEYESVAKDHEEELENMQKLLASERASFKRQQDELLKRLKDMLDRVESIRKKHEHDLSVCHTKLLDALKGQATFDFDDAVEKVKSIRDLQDTYGKKSREYEDLIINTIVDQYGQDSKHEGAVRQLNVDLKWLAKEMIKDGIKSPEQRLTKIKALLETKQKQHEKSGGDDQSPIMDNVEEAKSKNSELKDKLRTKKKEIHDLMQKRQEEISHLTQEILKHNSSVKDSKADDDVQSQHSQQSFMERCVLDDVPGTKVDKKKEKSNVPSASDA